MEARRARDAQAIGIAGSGPVRRQRSAATREQLLRAALALFRQRGYHGAGTNDIGAAAGLTGPSIYRHFASKDDILVTAVLDAARRLGDDAEVAKRESDPFVALQILCRSFAEYGVENPDVYAVYFFEARHAPGEATTVLYETGRRYLKVFESSVAALLPHLSKSEVEARVSCAVHMTAGMCLQQIEMPSDQLVSLLADRMLAVLLAPSPRRPRSS